MGGGGGVGGVNDPSSGMIIQSNLLTYYSNLEILSPIRIKTMKNFIDYQFT